MFWFEVWHLFSSVVDLFMVRRLTYAQEDIPILVLRQQVRVLQHRARQPQRFSHFEKTAGRSCRQNEALDERFPSAIAARAGLQPGDRPALTSRTGSTKVDVQTESLGRASENHTRTRRAGA